MLVRIYSGDFPAIKEERTSYRRKQGHNGKGLKHTHLMGNSITFSLGFVHTLSYIAHWSAENLWRLTYETSTTSHVNSLMSWRAACIPMAPPATCTTCLHVLGRGNDSLEVLCVAWPWGGNSVTGALEHFIYSQGMVQYIIL